MEQNKFPTLQDKRNKTRTKYKHIQTKSEKKNISYLHTKENLLTAKCEAQT